MKPFVCGMIGGGFGAWFGAISGIGATTYGVTGIPGLLAIDNIPVYVIMLLIASGVAFILTWFVWKEDPDDVAADKKAREGMTEKAGSAGNIKEAVDVSDIPVVMSVAGIEVKAPAIGKIVKREDIPDETFATGVLGDGVGIEPDEEYIIAPVDGEISTVAESKHAIGITGADDTEFLIHVGVDTVAMNGEGFTPLVNEGDTVKAGQKILEFSKEKIKAANHPDVVVFLLTNSDDYDDFKVEH
jgi:PTS system sucrose-specific IIC component